MSVPPLELPEPTQSMLRSARSLLRRKEREPGEGDDRGPFTADRAGDQDRTMPE